LISKAGWVYTLIPSIFCPKFGGNLKIRNVELDFKISL